MDITNARQLQILTRERRKDLGLSQQALAQQIGVSRKWVSEFELGKGDVELAPVLRLLTALRLRLDAAPSDSAVQPRSEEIDLDTLLDAFEPRRDIP